MINDDKPYIEIKLDGETHRTTLAHDEMFTDELIDKFCRLLVCAGSPPTVLNRDDEDGRWFWLHNDERIVPIEEGDTQGGRIMDFEERWGFAPDSDYEELKCNKTPKENK